MSTRRIEELQSFRKVSLVGGTTNQSLLAPEIASLRSQGHTRLGDDMDNLAYQVQNYSTVPD